MKTWIKGRINELAKEDLCGFIFRSKSPSSGLYRIRVYGDDGNVRKNGTGLVAQGKNYELPDLIDNYEKLLLRSLRLPTTLKKNINVLQHIMGYFKKNLNPDEKQELLSVFEQYRSGYVPLIVPITLIKHYVRKYDQPWLKTQTYLNPLSETISKVTYRSLN